MFAEMLGIGYGLGAEQDLRAAFAEVRRELSALGITADRQTLLPPDKTELHRALAAALSRTDVVVTVGGLGIGPRDVTLSAVSAAVGIPLALNEQVLQDMRERRDVSGENPESAERRAMLPSGAAAFPNPRGQMCGSAISAGAQCIIMLPAELPELVPMLVNHVSRYLAGFCGGETAVHTIRLFGMSAEEAEEKLGERASAINPAATAFFDCGETVVQITARAVTAQQAENTAMVALKTSVAKFGHSVYGVDVDNIQQALVQELYAHGARLSCAEEGTGGALRDRLSRVRGISGVMAGAVRSFAELALPEKKLKKFGAQSEWAAAAAASAIREKTGSELGVAIAMDMAAGNEAVIAVTNGADVWLRRVKPREGDRVEARELAVLTALHMARSATREPESADAVPLAAVVAGKKLPKAGKEPKQSGSGEKARPENGAASTAPRKKKLKVAVLVLCALVFLGSIGYIGSVYYESYKNRQNTGDLLELFDQSKDGAYPVPLGYPEGWLPEFAAWYDINPDVIGHVYIDGTGLNYPVVQTSEPGATGLVGQWYLRRDFYGKDNQHGIPFLDYRAAVTPGAETTNLVIYGHNMKDGQMFGELMSYKTLAYYKEHPTIHFDSVYAESEWKIVAVIITNAYEKDGPVWNYHNFIDGGDGTATQNFIDACAARTLITTGVDALPTDRFVTLSTCSYEFLDARFVLVARQVRAGESAEVDTSAAYYNPSPLMPDEWYDAIAQAQAQDSTAQGGQGGQGGQSSGAVETPSENEQSSSQSSSINSAVTIPGEESGSSSQSGSSSSTVVVVPSESSSTPSSSSEPVQPPSSSTQEPPSSSVPVQESPAQSESTSSSDPNIVQIPGVSYKPSSSSSYASSSAQQSSSSSSVSSSPPMMMAPPTNSGAGAGYEDSLDNTFTVNGKSMSQYDAVCQIVAGELGAGTTAAEAIKAQAVAAYTYISYNGGRISATLRTPTTAIKNAVREVIGLAVYDDSSGKLINAVYSAESCGVTASAQWVWGGASRNLVSVDSPVDGVSSKTYTISADSFKSQVGSKLGIELSGDPEDWISIRSYWENSDYINEIYLGDTKTTARKLRENCLGGTNLRSTAFTVSYNSANDSFTFTTWGYGHGVGLSQLGAIAYANKGWSYDEILLHYYSNCYIG